MLNYSKLIIRVNVLRFDLSCFLVYRKYIRMTLDTVYDDCFVKSGKTYNFRKTSAYFTKSLKADPKIK